MAKKKIKVPHGSVLMRHATDPNASCTVDGVSYEPTDGGVVVPFAAVEALRGHGFAPDSEGVEQDAAPEPEAPEVAAEVEAPEAGEAAAAPEPTAEA